MKSIDTARTTDAPPEAPAPQGGLHQRLGRSIQQRLDRWLACVQAGSLRLTLPDGTLLQAEGPTPGPAAALHLRRWRPLWRLLLEGDTGLAFSYRDGDWTSPDLSALFAFGLANEAPLGAALDARGPARWLSRLLHRRHANTRRGSRDNIAFHYDLGNGFYAQWLDDSMLYSSAWYEDESGHAGGTLESAQARKLNHIIELLSMEPGMEVLEIGCGWGTLAATLANRFRSQVTGLTLSAEQLAYARERALQWKAQPVPDLRLQDYRDVTGHYDRIVSIEMIEAVGEAYWPTYFSTLRDRLRPGGVAVIQAITIDAARFEHYRAIPDFIQRCIFPGGMLPTPELLHEHARRAGLVCHEALRFGNSYAATLAEWRRRFLAAWPAIEAQGFDLPFKRLWEYYLSYCEAGFRAGRVDVGLYRFEHA